MYGGKEVVEPSSFAPTGTVIHHGCHARPYGFTSLRPPILITFQSPPSHDATGAFSAALR